MRSGIPRRRTPGYRQIVWWLLPLACAHREVTDPTAPIAGLVARADDAWRDRATGGLDAVDAALGEAWQLDPAAPTVRWRIARAQVERALATEDPAARAAGFTAARNLAIACIEADPDFVAERTSVGWVSAVSKLPADRLPCAAWAGVAWTRWLAVRGAAASALDLPVVDALLGAGAASKQDEAVDWARSILLAVRPTWDGQDLPAATQQLQAARKGPGAWVHAVDALEFAVLPSGDEAAIGELCAWLALDPQGVGTEADRAARTRGRALCADRSD
jgi:hypothetical protein